jgi:hypothetical protein
LIALLGMQTTFGPYLVTAIALPLAMVAGL